MKLFTNQIANTFSTVKQFVTFVGGNRAYATVAQLNEIITKLSPMYKVTTYPNNIVAKDFSLNNPVLSSREKFVYNTVFKPSVFTALNPGFKLNIIDIENQSELTSVERLEVVIGYEGLNNWDGGDFQLWLGNSLVATIPSATMTNTSGTPNYSKSLLVPITNVIELATGTYTAGVSGRGIQFNNPKTMFNIRLTSKTTSFIGAVGLNMIVAKQNNAGCGTWCETTCNFNDPASTVYCSIIAGNKCSYCKIPNGAWDSGDVNPV
jgi:hypothetical protein